MPKITNNSKALQGVHTVSGVVYLKPGQSRDLELNDAALAQVKRLSFMDIAAGVVVDNEPDDTVPDRAELKKQAGELGITFARNITDDKLKELIDAKLAA